MFTGIEHVQSRTLPSDILVDGDTQKGLPSMAQTVRKGTMCESRIPSIESKPHKNQR
jgi:hypothetical protein